MQRALQAETSSTQAAHVSVAQSGRSATVLCGTSRRRMPCARLLASSSRLVVYNDAHDPVRQRSDLAHELSHALLQHPPKPAIDHRGCRDWDPEMEEEANWLAGALLVSEEAALTIARRGMSPTSALSSSIDSGCFLSAIRETLPPCPQPKPLQPGAKLPDSSGRGPPRSPRRPTGKDPSSPATPGPRSMARTSRRPRGAPPGS